MNQIHNPILRGFNPDPAICRVGDDYYIATSTFEWYPGVQIFHSKNLSDWKLVSRPLDRASLLDLTGVPDSCGVWAPCLTYADGLFWLVYTAVTRFDGNFKDTHNFITTAPSIDGPWSEPVYTNSSGFDPSLFHDDDGRKWYSNMVWDHRPDTSYFLGIVLQEYSHEEKKLIGPRKVVFEGTKTDFTEGPHIYKRDGYYYMMTAEGGTGYNHAVTMVRSKDIWGPYEEDPELHVMTARNKYRAGLQRTGHASIIEDTDGRWWMAHLCSRPIDGVRCSPMGRESALQEVHWDDEGWLRLSHPETAYDAHADHPKEDVRYSFDGDELPADFQWLRTPKSERLFSTTANDGKLTLYGRDSMGSYYYSSIVARRQQHFNYRAETKVSFAPEDFQQMAGLTAYYNSHKFHYLYISRDEEVGRHLNIMSCDGDMTLATQYPINEVRIALPDEGDVWLACDVEGVSLAFSYSLDGETWTPVGPTLNASTLSDEAGKGEGANFTGAFVGMACQDVTGRGREALFDYFHYKEN